TRRMFGGGLPHVWPFATVALHYMAGFEDRFRASVEASEQVIKTLSQDANFSIERIPSGTNIFRMRVFNVNAPVYQQRLDGAGIAAADPVNDWFLIQVNETWSRIPPAEIVARFRLGL